MRTDFKIYTSSLSNCPPKKDETNCPLRKKLKEAQEQFNIGYTILEDGSLLFPDTVYDKENRISIDMRKTKNKICSRCRIDADLQRK